MNSKELLKASIYGTLGAISYAVFKHLLERKDEKADAFTDEHFEYTLNKFKQLKEEKEKDDLNITSQKPLSFLIGYNHDNTPRYTSLLDTKHMLLSGITGSGKTIFIRHMLIDLLYRAFKQGHLVDVIMFDSKHIQYDELERLNDEKTVQNDDYISETKDIYKKIEELNHLADERKCIFDKHNVSSIEEYNTLCDKEPDLEKMAYKVVVIDDLGRLMSDYSNADELITNVINNSKSAGIYFILLVTHPHPSTITPLLKANITSRIGFKSANETDSIIILDETGAERISKCGLAYFVEHDKPKELISIPYVYCIERDNTGHAVFKSVFKHIENNYIAQEGIIVNSEKN